MSSSSRIVAIVGRPNVGKSALFNRLAGKQISLVHDRPGVTRDRIVMPCRLHGHPVELVDTGGLGLDDGEGFANAITHEVEIAISTAADILFVVDGREGVTTLDEEVAHRLRRQKSRVLLVVNKIDLPQHDSLADEFNQLGLGTPLGVSAAHGYGIAQLLETLTQPWPEISEAAEEIRPRRPTRLAIVGKPNVGKSSLINALLHSERAIVSPTPGTTRDAVDAPFDWEGERFTLIDTAGMRQQRKVLDALEVKMTGRSAHTINRADLCVLVIDVTEGVTMQEKKIGGLISEARKPCILLCNKWDLAEAQGDTSKKTRDLFIEGLRRDLFFIDYAPILFASAKTGDRILDVMKTVARVHKNRYEKVPTARLNDLLHRAQERTLPPIVHGKRFKIYYATQQLDENDVEQIPTLLCFCNSRKFLTPSYLRYLEVQVRTAMKIEGCPLRWVWKEKPMQEAGERKAKSRFPSKTTSEPKLKKSPQARRPISGKTVSKRKFIKPRRGR